MLPVKLCAACAAKLTHVLRVRRSFTAVEVATETIQVIRYCARCKAQVPAIQLARRTFEGIFR